LDNGVKRYEGLRTLGLDRIIINAYSDHMAARTLLERVGYPRSRVPGFFEASSFWSAIFVEIENGVRAAGFHRLLKVAAEDFPGNKRLVDCKLRSRSARRSTATSASCEELTEGRGVYN